LVLPTGPREEFLKKYTTSLFVAHGAVLKEYVEVPVSLFKNTAELLTHLDISYAYVLGLKPRQQQKAVAARARRAKKKAGE